jgi:heptosyltransferase-1
MTTVDAPRRTLQSSSLLVGGSSREPDADMSSAEREARDWKSQIGSSPRILVVRLGSLGDIIHTLPAVAILRDAMPEAFIGWVVEERWAELLCSRADLRRGDIALSAEKPLVNAVHTVSTRAWRRQLFRRSTREQIASAVRELRASCYDVALDFQSAIRSAVLGHFARPQQFFGFSCAHEEPASLFYSRRVEAQGRHMVEQNASLSASLMSYCHSKRSEASGLSPDHRISIADDFRFPLPRHAGHDLWAADQLKDLGIREFCLLNAGAGWGAKIWPSERWAEVAIGLAQRGLRSIINFGPGEEDLARRAEQQSGGAAVAIAPSIGQLIALACRASLFVGGDTGPTHLAAALGIPIVAIYGPTDPARNGPYAPSGSNAPIVVLRSQASITDHARRREPEPGMLQITPQHVIAAAEGVLAKI